MMRERSVFPDIETYNGNDITDERKREVRREIDYTNAIEELEASIAYAIDQSPLRRDGETIKYVLERVWNKYLYLALPDIVFKDETTNT